MHMRGCARECVYALAYTCVSLYQPDLDKEAVGDSEELEVPLRADHVPVVIQRRLFLCRRVVRW